MKSLIKSPLVAGAMKYGTWGAQLEIPALSQLIDSIVDLGITAFDHADIYGDYEEEERFGEALKASGVQRQDLQLITKCGIRLLSEKHPIDTIKHYQTSKEYIIAQTESSLKKLRTDYIDILLIHRPSPLMNPQEMAEAFTSLKKDGKLLHVGVSNFTPSQFEMLDRFFPLVTNQVEASLFHVEPFIDGTFDQAQKHGCRPMIWSPLGGGEIFTNEETKRAPLGKKLKSLSESTGHTIDQLLLAFLLKHPAGLIPILGSTKIERYQTAIDALAITLSDQDWFELWSSAIGGDVA